MKNKIIKASVMLLILLMATISATAIVPTNKEIVVSEETEEYLEDCPCRDKYAYDEMMETTGDSYYTCMIGCMTALGISTGSAMIALIYLTKGSDIGTALMLAGISLTFAAGVYGCHSFCSGMGGGISSEIDPYEH